MPADSWPPAEVCLKGLRRWCWARTDGGFRSTWRSRGRWARRFLRRRMRRAADEIRGQRHPGYWSLRGTVMTGQRA
jgi:hypothetical protein